jgi:NAD-dependent SIR2 family protein deacetylase
MWAFWSRNIYVNRYVNPPKPVYEDLFSLVKDKDYFVITTNVDHCFQKAGIDKSRLFWTQGDYGLFQCSVPCHKQTYDNEEIVKRMVNEQKDMKIPTELIPRCPKCGKPMTMNLRSDSTFVEDKGWHEACERYENFLSKHKKGKVLYIELGVGGNTPSIIKYPFWRMTSKNPDATYVCVNLGEAFCPPQIEKKSVCIDDDIGHFLNQVVEVN